MKIAQNSAKWRRNNEILIWTYESEYFLTRISNFASPARKTSKKFILLIKFQIYVKIVFLYEFGDIWSGPMVNFWMFLWPMMNDPDWSWLIMINHDQSWSIMINRGRSWWITIDHGQLWSIMMDHDQSWCIMISSDP